MVSIKRNNSGDYNIASKKDINYGRQASAKNRDYKKIEVPDYDD